MEIVALGTRVAAFCGYAKVTAGASNCSLGPVAMIEAIVRADRTMPFLYSRGLHATDVLEDQLAE
jgi:hypothetical protein